MIYFCKKLCCRQSVHRLNIAFIVREPFNKNKCYK